MKNHNYPTQILAFVFFWGTPQIVKVSLNFGICPFFGGTPQIVKVGLKSTGLRRYAESRVRIFRAISRSSSPPRLVCMRTRRRIKTEKSHHPYISLPRRSAATDPKWIKLGSVCERPNTFTRSHFQVQCLNAVGMAEGPM